MDANSPERSPGANRWQRRALQVGNYRRRGLVLRLALHGARRVAGVIAVAMVTRIGCLIRLFPLELLV